MQEENDTDTIPQMVENVRTGKMSRRELVKSRTAIGISASWAATIADVASHFVASAFTPAVNPHQNGAHNIHLHQQHLAHQTQGNTGALQYDYAENAVVEDSMYGQPFVGRVAIMSRKGIGMAAIPDLKITVTNRVAHVHQVTVEWIATGTHTGDFPKLPASGRPFSIRGVTVVIRQEGKIVRESIYYDMDEVRRQLGPG